MTKEYFIDCEKLRERSAAHRYLAKTLEFPEFYGGNLDALFDCMTEKSECTIIFKGAEGLYKEGGYGAKILEVMQGAAAANPLLKMDLERGLDQMVIRDAEPKDANCLDELLTRLIHDEVQYDSNLNADCVVKDNYCSRIGADGHKFLVAENEGEIIGYLYGFIYKVPDIWVRPIAILDALFVDEKYRRMGIASTLISEFKKFAHENGACRVELKVVSENIKAFELYSKLSFKEIRKYMCIDV